MKSMIMKFGLGLIAVLLVFSSCNKIENTVAVVKVVNEKGTPIPGASVHIFPTGSTDEVTHNPPRTGFDTIGTTNGSGKVTFDFSEYYVAGQAGFAVLDIEVSKGSLVGEGLIKIEEEETTEEVVSIQ